MEGHHKTATRTRHHSHRKQCICPFVCYHLAVCVNCKISEMTTSSISSSVHFALLLRRLHNDAARRRRQRAFFLLFLDRCAPIDSGGIVLQWLALLFTWHKVNAGNSKFMSTPAIDCGDTACRVLAARLTWVKLANIPDLDIPKAISSNQKILFDAIYAQSLHAPSSFEATLNRN